MIPARSPTPAPISLTKLLLVEGDTPMHFFEAMLRHLKLDAAVEVRNFRGVGDFHAFIAALAATAEFRAMVTSVGVVRDAEDRPALHARQSVEASLVNAGLTPARTPPVRTSVFILPDDTNPGMIETLCMEAVRGEPSLAGTLGCITDFFTCLARNGVALPSGPVLAKNHVEAYLATRPEPQLFPGLAAYRGYWPWSSPAFQPLIQFLQAL